MNSIPARVKAKRVEEIPQEEHTTGAQRLGSTEPWGNSPQERPDDNKRSTLPENLSNISLRVSLKGHH